MTNDEYIQFLVNIHSRIRQELRRLRQVERDGQKINATLRECRDSLVPTPNEIIKGGK